MSLNKPKKKIKYGCKKIKEAYEVTAVAITLLLGVVIPIWLFSGKINLDKIILQGEKYFLIIILLVSCIIVACHAVWKWIKIGKIFRHWIYAVLLLYVSYLALALYYWDIAGEKAENMALSLSTGTISGFILLFITGIREKQIREIRLKLEMEKRRIDIYSPYSQAYHKLYHRKREKFIKNRSNEYAGILLDALKQYHNIVKNVSEKETDLVGCRMETDLSLAEIKNLIDYLEKIVKENELKFELLDRVYENLYTLDTIIMMCDKEKRVREEKEKLDKIEQAVL